MKALSRRDFINGTAGVAATALWPRSRGTGGVDRPLAGATIGRYTYDARSYRRAANIFDGYVGLPLATTMQKVYTQGVHFRTEPPAQMMQLAATGCHFLIDVHPSKNRTRDERHQLAKWLAMLRHRGISHRVLLRSECNNTAFATAEEWLAYWRYYAPVIKEAGVPCCYNPGCNPYSITRAETYFPSRPAPDELWMDYYATAFRSRVRIDRLIAKARAAGVPAGLAEWGWHAGSSQHNRMTMTWWDRYGAYLVRLAGEGKLKLGTVYFGSGSNGLTVDVITSAKDPRIPVIRRLAIM